MQNLSKILRFWSFSRKVIILTPTVCVSLLFLKFEYGGNFKHCCFFIRQVFINPVPNTFLWFLVHFFLLPNRYHITTLHHPHQSVVNSQNTFLCLMLWCLTSFLQSPVALVLMTQHAQIYTKKKHEKHELFIFKTWFMILTENKDVFLFNGF